MTFLRFTVRPWALLVCLLRIQPCSPTLTPINGRVSPAPLPLADLVTEIVVGRRTALQATALLRPSIRRAAPASLAAEELDKAESVLVLVYTMPSVLVD